MIERNFKNALLIRLHPLHVIVFYLVLDVDLQNTKALEEAISKEEIANCLFDPGEYLNQSEKEKLLEKALSMAIKRDEIKGELKSLRFPRNGSKKYYEADLLDCAAWAYKKGFELPKTLESAVLEEHYKKEYLKNDEKPLRQSQLDKRLVQAVALTVWEYEPTLSIEAMKECKAVQEFANGSEYPGKNTLRDWISEAKKAASVTPTK